ncbi:unnamed protein product [Parascedosporium putredinis]|uniref:Cytochrome c oxidase assembly factor 3 n=1 Tax=Parascedosporium putredinis TaxID=1442378 RepID=A0A9P1H7I6_9PEZI|nr:unnamed protein product [Parascedosporium putredinis]CAI7998470.1 unnamed protein product [Parascedosporium putredinis]
MAGAPRSTSYYDRNLRQGPALIRARRPYLVKNAVTGLALLGVVSGVYMWTINAVGQDNFEDVKVPDAPHPASGTTQKMKSRHYAPDAVARGSTFDAAGRGPALAAPAEP